MAKGNLNILEILLGDLTIYHYSDGTRNCGSFLLIMDRLYELSTHSKCHEKDRKGNGNSKAIKINMFTYQPPWQKKKESSLRPGYLCHHFLLQLSNFQLQLMILRYFNLESHIPFKVCTTHPNPSGLLSFSFSVPLE